MAQTVIGMFDSTTEAQQAVETLTNRGFSRTNIDVTNNNASTGAGYVDPGTDYEESGISKFFRNIFSNDDDSEKYSNVAKRSQSIVTVHAQSADEAEEAADILDDCGAVNVDERAASYGYTGSGTETMGDNSIGNIAGLGTTNTNSSVDDLQDYSTSKNGSSMDTVGLGTTSTNNSADSLTEENLSNLGTRNADIDETSKINIIEENLEVGKREVLRGGVRLRSRIIERPVEESVRLREETVRVERTPVDRAATSSDLENFKAIDIEMTERAEIPVVSKEARVVEEVSLGKEVSERTETITDTVRRTDVDIEKLDDTTDRGTSPGF